MTRSALRSIALVSVAFAATACDQSPTSPNTLSHGIPSPSLSGKVYSIVGVPTPPPSITPPSISGGPFTVSPSLSNPMAGTYQFNLPVGAFASDPNGIAITVTQASLSANMMPLGETVSVTAASDGVTFQVHGYVNLPLAAGMVSIYVCASDGPQSCGTVQVRLL